jgi:hypothetical protein
MNFRDAPHLFGGKCRAKDFVALSRCIVKPDSLPTHRINSRAPETQGDSSKRESATPAPDYFLRRVLSATASDSPLKVITRVFGIRWNIVCPRVIVSQPGPAVMHTATFSHYWMHSEIETKLDASNEALAEIKMPSDRDRLDKVLAIAVNPGAYETEAVAALRAARHLIKKNPSLAHPPRHLRVRIPKPAPLAWISTERYSPNSRTAPSQSAESLAC